MIKKEICLLIYITVISIIVFFLTNLILFLYFTLLVAVVVFGYKNIVRISKHLHKYMIVAKKKSISISSNSESFVIPVRVIEKKLLFTYGDHSRSRHCEFLVERYLSTLDKDIYTVMNDVTLPSIGGNTTNTQIDHVVVSRYGIFSIETKSHRGWIYCKENEKSWLQILSKSCNEFFSPSRQNYAHKCALNNLLGGSLKSFIVPIVVLTSADIIIKKGNINVGNIGYLLREIDKYKNCIYTQSEYERIVDLIKYSNKDDEKTAYEHNLEVNNLVASFSY